MLMGVSSKQEGNSTQRDIKRTICYLQLHAICRHLCHEGLTKSTPTNPHYPKNQISFPLGVIVYPGELPLYTYAILNQHKVRNEQDYGLLTLTLLQTRKPTSLHHIRKCCLMTAPTTDAWRRRQPTLPFPLPQRTCRITIRKNIDILVTWLSLKNRCYRSLLLLHYQWNWRGCSWTLPRRHIIRVHRLSKQGAYALHGCSSRGCASRSGGWCLRGFS
jgi:hypothetical protein